jgi:hypothetical protein
MLNELFELSRSLKHCSLLQSVTNPNVRNVGKVYCLLIEIDKDGVPRETRLLQKEETAVLWKHSKGNHNSFPAIRVQKPLLTITESIKINNAEWKKAKLSEKISYLKILNYDAINPGCLDIKISDWSLNELAKVVDSVKPELVALRQLIRVFPNSSGCIDFNKMLADYLYKKIVSSNNEMEIDFIKELLVGNLNEKTGKYVAGCMTYYDVYETADYDNIVGSTVTQRALINLLNSGNEGTYQSTNQPVVSPLSGMRCAAIENKYPNPNIPLLGLTYLYSKKSDTPCLTRYKMSGTEAYRAGKDEVMAINDAIAFLTDVTRKNKSWKAMSDSNHDKPNLLLAYLPDDPQNDACLAQVLGDPSDYESADEFREETESVFDALCQQVLGNMESVIRKNPMSKINLILLGTLDPGRKQVVYENTLTAEQFRKNLLVWSEAAKNHPNIIIHVWNKKEVVDYKPICPGPNDICQLLKINYTHSGSSKPMKQSAVSLHDIYRLYMPPEKFASYDDAFLSDIICKVIEKTAQMLGNVGNQLIKEYALPSTGESHTRAKHVALTISLISILLWRLGVRKENYMLEAPFNVGQFLQLSDMLHKEYCIQVRNSGNKKAPLPSQLMGSEMLVIASENPVEGLIRLRDRMKIYLSWAKTITGEGSGLVKWILARYGEVSAKIAAGDLPEQFNAAEQAQVLLGYLATIPYDKKDDKEVKPNE